MGVERMPWGQAAETDWTHLIWVPATHTLHWMGASALECSCPGNWGTHSHRPVEHTIFSRLLFFLSLWCLFWNFYQVYPYHFSQLKWHPLYILFYILVFLKIFLIKIQTKHSIDDDYELVLLVQFPCPCAVESVGEDCLENDYHRVCFKMANYKQSLLFMSEGSQRAGHDWATKHTVLKYSREVTQFSSKAIF